MDILQNLISHTNPALSSRLQEWKDTNSKEMYLFLAVNWNVLISTGTKSKA